MKRFVILSNPRSKSNLLVSLLNNHPSIVCHGEVYGRYKSILSLKQVGVNPNNFSEGNDDYFRLLETIYNSKKDQQTAAIGFKLFPFQNSYIFKKVLEDQEILKVILIRNYLFSFTSREISDITGQYLVTGEGQSKKATIDFDFKVFIKYYKRVHTAYQETIRYLHNSGQSYHIVFAEDLHTISGMNTIYSFLGLPPLEQELTTALKPQNPSSLEKRLNNFEQTKITLSGTLFEPYLKGDEVPYKESWLYPENWEQEEKKLPSVIGTERSKFVILSTKRSKSNLLVSLMGNHKEVLCHAEAFDRKKVYVSIKPTRLGLKDADDIGTRDRNPVGFLEKLFSSPSSKDTKSIGFKFFPLDQDASAFEYLKAQKDIKKIILIRNFLFAYTSFEITKKTNQWTLKENEEPKKSKIHFSLPEFLQFARVQKLFYKQLIKEMEDGGHEYILVFAEKLLNLMEMNRIFEFLGLSSIDKSLYTHFKQQNPADLKDRVENYVEMQDSLRGTEYEYLLEGDFIKDKTNWVYKKSTSIQPTSIGKHVIISLPRSKTQLFCSLLNNHPNILVHGELFKKLNVHITSPIKWEMLGLGKPGDDPITIRNANPIAFLEKIYSTPVDEENCNIGFKIFPDQNNQAMDHLMADDSIRKIILIRNFLYSFLSLHTAIETGKWRQKKGEQSQHKVVKYDHEKFLSYFNASIEFYKNTITQLKASGHPYYTILAENLLDKQEINQVFNFLDLPPIKGNLATSLVQQNPGELKKRVANYDEMVTNLKKNQLGALLQGDLVPDQFIRMLTDVEKGADKEEWEKKIDAAKKGEELYEIPSKYIFPRIQKSLQHIYGPEYIDGLPDDVYVFCLFKNSERCLKDFIEYYRDIGVRHIFFLDNGSTDQSIDIIKKYENVSLFKSEINFTVYERVMREYMVQTYGKNKWCLVADIDEYFCYPFSDYIQLPKLIKYLNEKNYTGVVAQMLDMFANRPLLENNEDETLAEHCFYDISTIAKHSYFKATGTKVPNNRIAFHKGGIRLKAFGLSDVYITKTPLFYCNAMINYGHIHYLQFIKLADFSAVLKHYKFYGDFEAKNAHMVDINCHQEFGAYSEVLRENPTLNLYSDSAKKWSGTEILIIDSFIEISSDYLNYVFQSLWDELKLNKDQNQERAILDKVDKLFKFSSRLVQETPKIDNGGQQARIADLKRRLVNMQREIDLLETEKRNFNSSFTGRVFGLLNKLIVTMRSLRPKKKRK